MDFVLAVDSSHLCSATSLKESNHPSHWKDQTNKKLSLGTCYPILDGGTCFHIWNWWLKKTLPHLITFHQIPTRDQTNSQNERNPASPRQGAEEGEGNYTPLMCGIRFKATFPRPKNSQFNGSVPPKNKQLNHFKQGDSWQSSKVITHFTGPS